jgi:hypothetical protein
LLNLHLDNGWPEFRTLYISLPEKFKELMYLTAEDLAKEEDDYSQKNRYQTTRISNVYLTKISLA